MGTAEKQLQTLLDAVLDATCSDSQRDEFGRLIEEHPELAAEFTEQLRIHSLLQWRSNELELSGLKIPQASPSRPGSGDSEKRATRGANIGFLAFIAVALLIAIGSVFWRFRKVESEPPYAIAEVVDEKGVVWSPRTTAIENGRLVHSGRLEIESGQLTLQFRSGPTVVLRGAASGRIESDMLMRLERGQATAQVPHWAKGFTIETADVEVIDLGTQFGVMARADGMTDVVIFEGQVDVKPTGGRQRVQKRLNQGEAARIASNGSIDRIVEVRSGIEGGWSTMHHADPSSVFKAIRDNIPPSDGSTYYYYQITARGLRDDAWAYVDRHPHQWNGLTPKGLPEILLDADYARMFNDYRYIHGFEIVVELAMPANLYVFFDDRVPTPEWLTERFEDTGIDIGLDEGPWEGIPDHRTAVGGGNSIDNIFSVWHRRCERAEEVTLGAVGDSNEARAMYGIAATPLELGQRGR